MPTAIAWAIDVVSSFLYEELAGTIITSAVEIAAAEIIVYAAAFELLNVAASFFGPKPPGGIGRDMSVSITDTMAGSRIILGHVRCGGVYDIPPFSSGPNGEMVHIVIALAGHQVQGFTDVWVGQDKIHDSFIHAVTGAATDGQIQTGGSTLAPDGTTSDRWSTVHWIRRYTGTSSQTVDYILHNAFPTAFTTDFRGRGIAYAAIQQQLDTNSNGGSIPQWAFEVDGALVYDPRLDSTQPGGSGSQRYATPSTWTYSNNSALCAAWLIMNPDLGGGFDPASEIDWTSVAAAANICATSMSGANAPPTGGQPKYTCSLLLDATNDFVQNLRAIVDTMVGHFINIDGVWRIYAGTWATPSLALDKSDFVGPCVIQCMTPRTTTGQQSTERYNGVRGFFIDPTKNWQRVECYPRTNASYMTADNGERIWKEAELPGITDEYTCQRACEFLLRQSRNQIVVSGVLGPKWLQLQTYETCSLTWDDMGWSSKTFRIVSYTDDPTGGVRIALREEQSADWNDLVTADYNAPSSAPIPTVNPTSPSPPTTLTATSKVGAIALNWPESVVKPAGTIYRLMECNATSGYAAAAETWRGLANKVTINYTDTTTRAYWIQSVSPFDGTFYSYPTSASAGVVGVPLAGSSISAQLTLPAWVFPSSSNGHVASYAGATGNMKVYLSGFDVSSASTFAVGSNVTALTTSIDTTGAYSITAGMPDGTDLASIQYLATYAGTTLGSSIALTKAKGGTAGATGSTGASGSPGVRGSKWFYGSAASWTDAAADAVIVAAGFTKVPYDVVTLSQTGFASTKFWDGAAWNAVAVSLDGNLLVAGTVVASKLAITALSDVTANTGNIKTAASGERIELNSSGSYPLWIGTGTVGPTTAAFYVDSGGNVFIGGAVTTHGGSSLVVDPGMTDPTAWVNYHTMTPANVSAGALAVGHVVTDGQTGNTTARSATNTTYCFPSNYAPCDPAKTYRMRCWVRKGGSANGTLYAGIALMDGSNANITGAGSFWSYSAALADAGSTSWTEYECVVGANTAETIPSTAKLMAPICLLNNGGSTGWFEVQDLRIEEVVDPSGPMVSARGSIPPTVPDQAFTYTSTTTTITISWVSMIIYRADGTSTTISSGSLAITGLTINTTYKVYPYVNDRAGATTVTFVSGGAGAGSPTSCYGSTGDAAAAAKMAARGNIPLNGFAVATTASGTGSGGGGGRQCLHPNQWVDTPVGRRRASTLKLGDEVWTKDGTARIMSLSGRTVSEWYSFGFNNAEWATMVTPDHRFVRPDGELIEARDANVGTILAGYSRNVQVLAVQLLRNPITCVSIEISAPHLYFITRDGPLSHNMKP